MCARICARRSLLLGFSALSNPDRDFSNPDGQLELDGDEEIQLSTFDGQQHGGLGAAGGDDHL
jgi:hypothetical protein